MAKALNYLRHLKQQHIMSGWRNPRGSSGHILRGVGASKAPTSSRLSR